MDFIGKPASTLLNTLRAEHVTASELLEITIEHAEKVSDRCNPFAVKLYDRARKKAKLADSLIAKGEGGALCGLPITVKDSQWLAGVPCANGSKTQTSFIPNESCEAIHRLEEAGAIIFAKTTCPEFSLKGITDSKLYGTTSNPWNYERTCGGASGGAAAAVAAGAGCLSLGDDAGGSIRIPAALCGVVGFKPTFKSVPREPDFPAWSSLISYGPLAKTVYDARLMYEVLTGTTCRRDRHVPLSRLISCKKILSGMKIIVSEDLGYAPLNEDVRIAFRNVVSILNEFGAEVIHDHPHLPSSVITWATVAHYDLWSHQSKKAAPYDNLEPDTAEIMRFGASISIEEFNSAEHYRDSIRSAYTSMFLRNTSTFFLTPTLGFEAFKHGLRHPKYIGSTKITYPWLDWATFLYDANLTGMPACSIPMGLGREGLPISLQISSLKGLDKEVLDLSEIIESILSLDLCPPSSI